MNVSAQTAGGKNVYYNEQGFLKLNQFLEENTFSNLFILVDSNSHEFCLAPFLNQLKTDIQVEVIEIEAGEEHKDLDTCNSIWKVLSELNGDRRSLMINLGGGVVTDLGGFVAATFKRGISWINFPTTLLSMVDAAVGGKNGVNLGSLKNQIGVIQPPEFVVINTSFLSTLPAPEMRSGLAEMLKHGLIQDEDYWKKLTALHELDPEDLDDLIAESVKIKEAIVEKDPTEQNLRKSLNYGHTLGHAIESHFLEHPDKQKLLHGEAVAVGIVLATFLSVELRSFPKHKLEEITEVIYRLYGKIEIEKKDQEKIIELLKFDKKNEGGNINFVLLEDIGKPIIDCHVPNELLLDAFRYYIDPQ